MNKRFSKLIPDFNKIHEMLNDNSKIILITAFVVFILTATASIGVFFLSLKSSEQVMVPNIVGKDIAHAMIEMQAKELYPKIQLKYSNITNDKGTILEQSPAPGSIVKAGRRINLVVSRGIIMDQVENYIGQNVDDVKMHLQSLFTSFTTPLVSIKEPPLYKFSSEPAGTILEQKPLPDTPIASPIKLELIISKGLEYNKTTVPDLVGKTITETRAIMEKSETIFDFSTRHPEGAERAGTVVSQMPAGGSRVDTYSRVPAVIAVPVQNEEGIITGIFTETLPEYPYPFLISLDAITPEGDREKLVTFKHPGGDLSIPYELQEGTVLVLTILNKEVSSYEVRAE